MNERCSLCPCVVELEGVGKIDMNIWDTAGQERFKGMNMAYLKGAAAAIVVYDIAEKESLEEAKWWLQQIKKQCNTAKIAVAMVGNKLDREDERKIQSEDIREFLEGLSFPDANAVLAAEVSAKTGDNLEQLGHDLAQRMVELGAN